MLTLQGAPGGTLERSEMVGPNVYVGGRKDSGKVEADPECIPGVIVVNIMVGSENILDSKWMKTSSFWKTSIVGKASFRWKMMPR